MRQLATRTILTTILLGAIAFAPAASAAGPLGADASVEALDEQQSCYGWAYDYEYHDETGISRGDGAYAGCWQMLEVARVEAAASGETLAHGSIALVEDANGQRSSWSGRSDAGDRTYERSGADSSSSSGRRVDGTLAAGGESTTFGAGRTCYEGSGYRATRAGNVSESGSYGYEGCGYAVHAAGTGADAGESCDSSTTYWVEGSDERTTCATRAFVWAAPVSVEHVDETERSCGPEGCSEGAFHALVVRVDGNAYAVPLP